MGLCADSRAFDHSYIYIWIGILLLILFGTEFNEHYAHNWPFKSIDERTVLSALAVVPVDSRH